jgi:hypothetical protein
MARTHTAEKYITYAVTSRSNIRDVASGVLCGSALLLLLGNCTVNISAAVNQHATIKEAFGVGKSAE